MEISISTVMNTGDIPHVEDPICIVRLYCGDPLHQPYISAFAEGIRSQHPMHTYVELDAQTESHIVDLLLTELQSKQKYHLLCECPDDRPENAQSIFSILRKLGALRSKAILHISGNSAYWDGYLQFLQT